MDFEKDLKSFLKQMKHDTLYGNFLTNLIQEYVVENYNIHVCYRLCKILKL